jgi:hypothetical protein
MSHEKVVSPAGCTNVAEWDRRPGSVSRAYDGNGLPVLDGPQAKGAGVKIHIGEPVSRLRASPGQCRMVPQSAATCVFLQVRRLAASFTVSPRSWPDRLVSARSVEVWVELALHRDAPDRVQALSC